MPWYFCADISFQDWLQTHFLETPAFKHTLLSNCLSQTWGDSAFNDSDSYSSRPFRFQLRNRNRPLILTLEYESPQVRFVDDVATYGLMVTIGDTETPPQINDNILVHSSIVNILYVMQINWSFIESCFEFIPTYLHI